MEQARPLSGRTALITGSAKGLGKMTALVLADMGCNIAVNYMKSEREANELAEQIRGLGMKAAAIRGDVSSRRDLLSMVSEVRMHLGEIDILINNAGPFIRERRLFADYREDEIDALLQGNFIGVLRLDHMVIPGMRSRGWGRIIHFGFGHSVEARGWPHRAVYAAAKVGLVSFTKTLAVEEASNGITVNMVCPGDIKGDYKERTIAQVEGLTDEESPHGRPGTGEDVARVVAFLCLPESDYVTGNIIDISGGFDPIRNSVAAVKQEET